MRRNSRMRTGSTNGVTSTSYSTATGITRSAEATGIAGSWSSIPVSANTDVPTNEHAATVITAATAEVPASCRTRPAR